MKISDFSQTPAIAKNWSEVGPVFIEFLKQRALVAARSWSPGDTADSVASKVKTLADLAEEMGHVGEKSAAPTPRMGRLEP